MVAQQDQSLLRLDVEKTYAAKRIRVLFFGLGAAQDNALVATHAGCFVDATRGTPAIGQIAFGSNNKESGLLSEGIQPRKVDIAAIHDVEGARFQNQFVEQADIVRLPLCNAK